jgi:outer membrane lipoprotein SlyB
MKFKKSHLPKHTFRLYPNTGDKFMLRHFSTFLLAFILLVTTACQSNMAGNVVTSRTSAGKVVYGTVASSRPVIIKENENMSENALGGAAGAVAGGVAGSAFGKGTGNNLSTVGAGLAGAVLGAFIQDQLGTQQGQEYIVKLDSATSVSKKSKTKRSNLNITGNRNIVEDDLSTSVTPAATESDTVSVIQADKQPLPNGTRVMVVFRDDGVRITPAQ